MMLSSWIDPWVMYPMMIIIDDQPLFHWPLCSSSMFDVFDVSWNYSRPNRCGDALRQVAVYLAFRAATPPSSWNSANAWPKWGNASQVWLEDGKMWRKTHGKTGSSSTSRTSNGGPQLWAKVRGLVRQRRGTSVGFKYQKVGLAPC